MIAVAENVGGWLTLVAGVVAAIIAGIYGTRQARTAATPAEQNVVFGAYKTLFEQLQVEVARLRVEVEASRRAEEDCQKATAELRARIAALEAVHE